MNKHPMKKQSFFTFSLALLFGGTLWAQQKQYTLQECVELALENNITIRQNQLEYASAEIDKRTAFLLISCLRLMPMLTTLGTLV